jgi:hypothetical protein
MQSGPSSFGTVATAYGSKATDSYYQLTGQATNTVVNDITVKGDLTVDGVTDLSGAVSMGSSLDVSGNVLIGGGLEVNESVTINGASGLYVSVGPISVEDVLVVYNRTQGLPPQLVSPAATVSGNVLIDASGSLSVPTGSVNALSMTATDVSSSSVSLTSLKALNRVGTPGAPVVGGVGPFPVAGQLGYAGALQLTTAEGGDPFLGTFYLPAGCSADSIIILSLITFLPFPPNPALPDSAAPTSWSPPSIIITVGGPNGFGAVIAMDQENAVLEYAVFKYFVVV